MQIPIFHAMESIWPLPFGLLLQRLTDGASHHQHFSIPNSRLNRSYMPYSSKDGGSCLQHNFNSQASSNNVVGDSDTISSLFILTHPLEEIQVVSFFLPCLSCIFFYCPLTHYFDELLGIINMFCNTSLKCLSSVEHLHNFMTRLAILSSMSV